MRFYLKLKETVIKSGTIPAPEEDSDEEESPGISTESFKEADLLYMRISNLLN